MAHQGTIKETNAAKPLPHTFGHRWLSLLFVVVAIVLVLAWVGLSPLFHFESKHALAVFRKYCFFLRVW